MSPPSIPRFTPVLQLAEVAMRYADDGAYVRIADVRALVEAQRVPGAETTAGICFNGGIDAVLAALPEAPPT